MNDQVLQSVIELKDVHFTVAGTSIINGISAKAFGGETIFIVGKSGGGKSTLLKICSCLHYPTKGDVIIHDMSLKNASKKQLMLMHRKDGFVFQDCALIANLSIFDNLALPLRYMESHSEKEIHELIQKSTEMLHLTSDLQNRPAALSMGEQKLASIARAFMNDPEILFCDEPLANLDIGVTRTVKNILRTQKEKKTTIVIVAHDINFIKEFADHIWILSNGILKYNLKNEELFASENKHILQEIF
jgi:ABC-type transporter Mla maintaining outer membrane lipid asymmetry ATPase subunit MlaF